MSNQSDTTKWRDANLLILSSSYPTNPESHEGGFVHELARRLVSTPFRPLVLSPHFHNAPMYEWWPPVRIFRFPYFFPSRYEQLAYGSGMAYNIRKNPLTLISMPLFLISEFLFSLFFILKNPIALIHTHWLIPQGLIGSLFHRLLNIPHIATVHGSDLNIMKKHPVLHPLCRFIVRNADIITINSTYMKRQLDSFAPESSAKIRVIPMGIDPEKFKATEFIDIKKKFEAGHLVLSVGRLIDLKGTIHLINAMPAVTHQFPDTVLLIIGAGPEKETLVNRAQELGLENRIYFLGIMGIGELPFYYHAADVFVLPSINKSGKTEALGVVLLEAMASGCPVIGSNVGGIPDIIVDEVNGFLVPEQDPQHLAEKIVQLLSDTDLQEKFQKNGLIRVREKFSWEKISKDFRDVFDLVLTEHKHEG